MFVTPDVALVLIAKPVKFNEYIKPICLSPKKSFQQPFCSDLSVDEPYKKGQKNKDDAAKVESLFQKTGKCMSSTDDCP